MAERLCGGNTGLALLANTLATVFALYVLIETLSPISGAHFNPLVTLVVAWGDYSINRSNWSKLQKNGSNSTLAGVFIAYTAILFIVFQLLGAVAGAWLANAMFDLPVLQFSSKWRGGWTATGQFSGWGQWLAEAVATAGLIVVILRSGAAKVNDEHVRASALVACYIGAAYWFTASTSFANPAAVMGRMFSDSFAGIAPASALGFVTAQTLGSVAGLVIANALNPKNTQQNQSLN